VLKLRKPSAREAFLRELRKRQPRFRDAVIADAQITALQRGERCEFGSKLDAVGQIARLCWASDAFAAQVLYRLRVALQDRGIPVLPQLAHRLSMVLAQVSIGDPVLIHPGVYVIHGQIVLDGIVEIGPGAVIGPWVTIGLKAGNVQGAVLENDVHVGTGAKIVGPVRIGAGARIGANAVVVSDVEPRSTVVGVPARPVDG
jgi:serine O-acetyltransferase